jgi:hypothetical protein
MRHIALTNRLTNQSLSAQSDVAISTYPATLLAIFPLPSVLITIGVLERTCSVYKTERQKR